MDKFQLMALMMGGGAGPAPASEEQTDPAAGPEQAAIAVFAADDLAVELGVAKVGQIVPIVLGTNMTTVMTGTWAAGSRQYHPALKDAIKNLQAPNALCRFCGKRDLLWLMSEEGKWKLHDPDGTIHVCERPLPFKPVVDVS